MTHISKVVPLVLVLLVALSLSACETFDGPTAPPCIRVGDTLAVVSACNTKAGTCDHHYILAEKSTCGA
jgi:predicted small secreted protein